MPRRRNIPYILVCAALFIILEAAALTIMYFSSPIHNTWLGGGTDWFLGTVWGGTESVKNYFSLGKENERLAEENQKLFSESIRLRSAADFQDYGDSVTDTLGNYLFIPARIKKISNNRQHNYIILDKGSEDGVTANSGIITECGVLGVIDAVSRHYCYARSFKNLSMKVSARLGKDGYVGSLSWDGISERGAYLEGIPQHAVFASGDTVFTSGFSEMFPPDIPLGIVGERAVVNGAYYRIKVKLLDDEGTRRFATIVCDLDLEEIKEMEEERHE